MKRNWAFLLFVALIFSGISVAQQKQNRVQRVSPVKLTLEEAINQALKHNYELKAKEKEVKSKKYEYKAVFGNLFPKITFSMLALKTNNPGWGAFYKVLQKDVSLKTFGRYMDMRDAKVLLQIPNMGFGTFIEGFPVFGGFFGDVLPDFQQGYEIIKSEPDYPWTGNFSIKFEVKQPLYTGGKLLTGLGIRKKDYLATKRELTRSKEKAIYDTSKAFYGALLAKEAIELARQAYKAAERHYRTALQMHQNGLAVFADVLRAKVYMLEARSRITEAKNNYLIAKKGLLLAMGMENLDPRDIDVQGRLICETVKQPVTYYQDYAMKHRSDLIAMRKKVDISKDMIKMQLAAFKPEVGLFYNYETFSNVLGRVDRRTGYHTYGIGLDWVVFNGLQRVYKYKAAKSTYKRYRHGEKGFEEFIKFNVYKAYEQMLIHRKKLMTAKENLNYAKEVLKITENSYRNQLVSIIDLLDTQTMYDKIKFDYAKANHDCQVAVLELKYQSGMLMEGFEQ